MKRTAVIICLLILFSSCAISHRTARITWPDRIERIEALCDIDMSWKDMKYSGSMSLKMKYPDRLQIEIYGPFGETVVYLSKDGGRFSFVTADEKLNDEKRFEERFGIKLNDFIEDIYGGSHRQDSTGGDAYHKRENYVVIYKLDNVENNICWKGRDGNICVRFLDVSFGEQG